MEDNETRHVPPRRCTNCRHGRYNGFLTSYCALTGRVHPAHYLCLYYGGRKREGEGEGEGD
jgi:hypothetical protein